MVCLRPAPPNVPASLARPLMPLPSCVRSAATYLTRGVQGSLWSAILSPTFPVRRCTRFTGQAATKVATRVPRAPVAKSARQSK